jgi:hypothetical protein
MICDLFMNTHTIKSKYNFILHLDLLIHSAFILGHSIKLLCIYCITLPCGLMAVR